VGAQHLIEGQRIIPSSQVVDAIARALGLSEEARSLFLDWDQARFQRTFGSKRLHHPIVGELTVDYESFSLPGDPDQSLYVYTTAPDSASRNALSLLASWTQSKSQAPVTASN
jgi:hypothetical protein